MATTTDNLSAAEKMQLEHEQAEAHHVTVEEVPDEDLKPHQPSSDAPDNNSPASASDKAAAAAKQKDTAPAKPAAKLDIQSEELFPSLSDASASKVPSLWGAKSVPNDKTNGNGNHLANGTGSSRTATPPPKTTRGGAPNVHIPGVYSETLTLQPQELKARDQLKRPLPQILQDLNRTSRATVRSLPAARGQKFEAKGPQEAAQQALKELVKQIGSTVRCYNPYSTFHVTCLMSNVTCHLSQLS